jgi:hypothetical protein
MTAFDRVLLIFGILLLLSFRADAHDPSMARTTNGSTRRK